jgi:hypothetical protein
MTLQSTQYTQIVDLISEGEIEGLVNGEQSIFLDNTPLRDAGNRLNFQGVEVDATAKGTQAQSPLKYGDTISEERTVGVTVDAANPVVRTIADNNVDAVRITLQFPVLYSDSGDKGRKVQIQISRRYSGGSYVVIHNDIVNGKSLDPYNRDYQIDLDGAFPVDIKVTRVTANSTSSKVQDKFNWSSYTKIIYGRLRYPNSAVIGLRLDAKQIGSIPKRSYRIRGIKVAIPDGVTVDPGTGRIVYPAGFVWSGNFSATKQWTNDPAWVLWDLLVNSRYGFGDHIQASQLDKFSFFTASQYCSALVPDGFGGTEPRFSCNVNIQSADDAYKLISDMCSVFRAMPYWSEGALSIAQDAPDTVAHLFTLANVTQDGFSYQGSSLKGRPTVAIVSYFDMDTRDVAQEVIEDQDGIQRYGIQTAEIQAFACTSRGQAHRLGEWLLYSNRYETEVITFSASLDAGVVLTPGQIVEVSDPTRSGQRRGGRITSATTTAITVDSATGLVLGTSPTLSVILPTGAVESRTVSSIVGSVITVSSAYSTAPNVNSIWLYQTEDLEASTWRIVSIAESEQAVYTISAVAYNSSKYDYIERDVPLQFRDITNLNEVPSAPSGLTLQERVFESNGIVLAQLQVAWSAVTGIDIYRVRWRVDDGNWVETDQETVAYDIDIVVAGLYQVEVYSVDPVNRRLSATAAIGSVEAVGKTAAPASPTGLSLVAIDEASAVISWDRSTELDVILNGKVLIRHQPVLTSAAWESAQEIVAAAAGGQTQKQVPLLEGTYLLKFEDDTGNRSVTAASIIVDLPTPLPRLLVQTYTHPPFTGTFVDTFFFEAATGDGLSIANETYIDDMALDGNWDALDSIDNIGGALETGEYLFNQTLDLNQVYDVNVRRTLEFYTFIAGALWDDRTGDIDTWNTIDDLGDRTNALMYVRTTTDNPSGSPTWGDWREFANATVRGRGFQFKVVLNTTDATQVPVVTSASVAVEMQQRAEISDVNDTLNTTAEIQAGRDYTIVSAGTTNFTLIGAANNNPGTKFTATGPGTGTGTAAGPFLIDFVDNFYQSPTMGITIFNADSGDYYTLDTLSRTGVDLVIQDNSDKPVARNFQYTAVGYGKEIT